MNGILLLSLLHRYFRILLFFDFFFLPFVDGRQTFLFPIINFVSENVAEIFEKPCDSGGRYSRTGLMRSDCFLWFDRGLPAVLMNSHRFTNDLILNGFEFFIL